MKEALVIVAHPDDETLWMGGTILKNKDWNWTIFSLCRRTDKDRYPKFLKVCKIYNAKPIISNLNDSDGKPQNIRNIIKKIENNLKQKQFDFIFTHNEDGEYGHIRHKEVNKAVKQLIKDKKISCKALYLFSYNNEKFNKQLVLSDLLLNQKKKIITEVYGFKKHTPEATTYCKQIEKFLEIK